MTLTWAAIGRLTDEELRDAVYSDDATPPVAALLALEAERRMAEAERSAAHWTERVEYRRQTYMFAITSAALRGEKVNQDADSA